MYNNVGQWPIGHTVQAKEHKTLHKMIKKETKRHKNSNKCVCIVLAITFANGYGMGMVWKWIVILYTDFFFCSHIF